MATVKSLNVFKGPESLRQYFYPDEQPPLPLVELPEKLNPFRRDGVRIYAKLLTTLPAQNVKALPVLNMLLNDTSAAEKGLIEVSPGSTVTSLGITARVFYNNDDTTAFVSNKAPLDRMRELQFFGLKVALYGGPTYTDTADPRGPVEWARRLGRENPKMFNLGQYDNEHNWKSHVRWKGPQIWKQLPEINLFCMGMGSTGCVRGTGLIARPSSGMALQGLFDFLQREKDNGTLDRYADPSTAEISCVFICRDLPQKHLDTYFKKLSPENFKPIVND
ncbi:MAG: hypothetical protein Q9226_008423, partial [Calogaya cf. arnoldii]